MDCLGVASQEALPVGREAHTEGGCHFVNVVVAAVRTSQIPSARIPEMYGVGLMKIHQVVM